MDQDRMMMARLIKGTTEDGQEIIVGMYHNLPDITIDGERVGVCSCSYQYATASDRAGINALTATVLMNHRPEYHTLIIDFNTNYAKID